MEQRNKIFIPTGAEPEESLETPNFDAEETLLAARPVVPLSQDAIESARRAGAGPLGRRFPLLALIIIGAVCAGAAGGFIVALYQGRQRTPEVQVATSPSSTKTTVDTRFTQKPVEERSQEQLPSVQTMPETDKPVAEQPVASLPNNAQADKERPEQPAALEEPPDKKQASTPPVTRKKTKDEEREANDVEQKKPKPPKRRPRADEDRADDIPRQVERAGQELNRIREIFEGAQP